MESNVFKKGELYMKQKTGTYFKITRRVTAMLLCMLLMLSTFFPSGYENVYAADVLTAVDGVYQIADADDLMEFAALVNGGENSADAVLLNDIDLEGRTWTPIGNSEDVAYSGSFDGQGHHISHLVYADDSKTEENEKIGFFGTLDVKAVINGLIIDDTCSIRAYRYVGAIAGQVKMGIGSVKITNCGNEGAMSGVIVVNGLVGITYSSIVFENCYNAGTLTAQHNSATAFAHVGTGMFSTKGTITNSYNSGEIVITEAQKSEDSQGKYFAEADYTCKNCYQLKDMDTSLRSGIEELTVEQFASGEAAYKLNGSVTGGSPWRQDLADEDGKKADLHPVLDSDHALVYSDEAGNYANTALEKRYATISITCDIPKKDTAFPTEVTLAEENITCESLTWDTTDSMAQAGKTYQAKAVLKAGEGVGFSNQLSIEDIKVKDGSVVSISVSEDLKTAEIVFEMKAADISCITEENYAQYGFSAEEAEQYQGYYAIGNAEGLLLFSELVNIGAYGANAVLTADIDLTGKTWNPISAYYEDDEGSNDENHMYYGTFDGRGHRILHLEIQDGKYEVGMFGVVKDGAVIKNVIMDKSCNISGKSNIAGFVGEAYLIEGNTLTISSCGNEAAIDAEDLASGIISEVTLANGDMVINNCYNTGTVTAQNYAAAMISDIYIWDDDDTEGDDTENDDTVGGTIKVYHSYNAGMVTGIKESTGVFSAFTGKAEDMLINCYYQEGTVQSGTGATVKTQEQFESGEVAYLLNGSNSDQVVWYQNLGESDASLKDAYPTLTAGKDRIVYYDTENQTYYNKKQSGDSGNTGEGGNTGGNGNTGEGGNTGGNSNTGGNGNTGGSTSGNGTTGGNTGGGSTGDNGTTGGNGNTGGSSTSDNGTTGGNGNTGGSSTSDNGTTGANSSTNGTGTAGSTTGTTDSTDDTADTFTVKGICYTITGTKTVRVERITDQKKKTIKIPATVRNGQKTYQVTAIAAYAMKGNRKATKVSIGSNVKTIGKQAFYGCKKLKNITIKTTKLKNKSVGKQAFKGISKQAKIKVPAKKLKTYQRILRSKGASKSVKITK